MKRYDEAISLNDEALEIAIKINDNDVIFDSKILTLKIKAISDKTNAISELKDMLKKDIEKDGKDAIAKLHYELYKISGEPKYKEEAINIYKELYEEIPNMMYKERVDELRS